MNMTSEHNQQIRPSIFGDNSTYPQPNSFSLASDSYTQQNFPFSSNFGSAPVTFPIQTMDKYFPSTSQYNYPQKTTHPLQATFRYKRKIESPLPTANKQHITEEKMAEHLSKLHISSKTSTNAYYDVDDVEEHRLKRLFMCEEMLKLQTESILPKSILNNIQRPCTALVLWTPPQRILQDDDNNLNNNEEQVPDHNLMELDPR